MLAVSDALAADMAALGIPRSKIALNYTGLDRDRFRPLDHTGLRATLAASLGIALPANGPLIATVGALVVRKGQDLVMAALAELPGAHLLIVGKGEDDRHLRRLASDLRVADRVHFLGSVDHDLLPVILSAADVMALPSSHEGLANAWVESLACGTPLVIAEAGGARELVTGDGAGAIVARNVDAVRAGIADVLERKLPALAVTAFADRFSWQNNAADLAAHFTRFARQA